MLENLVDDSIPARLHVTCTLGVGIIGMKNRCRRSVCFRRELLIVEGPLLGIDQRVIRQRKQRKIARSFLRASIYIRMAFAGELAIGGFNLGGGRRPLNAQD